MVPMTLYGIVTDPSYSRTIDSDMALSSSLVPDLTVAPVAAQVTQISMALMAARLSDTNMVSSGCPDSRHPHLSVTIEATDINPGGGPDPQHQHCP